MKLKINLICMYAALYAALWLYSCGGDNDVEREVTPGRFPESDFSKELKDASIRFIDNSHEFRYNSGGIMFIHSHGTDRDTVSLLDIDNGSEVKLSWRGSLRKGQPAETALCIDGVDCPEHEIEVKQENSKGVWIKIQTPGGNNAVMVIGR